MNESEYASTGALIKVYLRDDRVITLLLVFLPFLLAYTAALSNMAVLQTPQQLRTYIAENQGNLLLGTIQAPTMAAVTIWRIRLSAALILSIVSIILIISNTRKDEEQGRLELLRAGAVGPRAPLTAAFVKVFGVSLLGGLAMTMGFIVVGFPATGSFVAGLALALCVSCFAAIAAIAAQVAPDARLARGISFGAIAFFALWQVVANATGSTNLLLWTPFGWAASARPYAGENPWLFAFAVLAIAVLTVVAFALSDRRDVGGSYVREQRGRARARTGFRTPLALAWRLQWGTLLVWVLAYGVMGLGIASLTPSIDKMLAGTGFLPELSAVMGGPGRAFLAILEYILTEVLTVYALLVILRMREEESLGRTELVLASSAWRVKYMASHLLIAFAGSAVAMGLFGLCTGDVVPSVERLPAVWVVASVAVFLYGSAPRAAAPASWGLFGVLLLLELLWELKVIGQGVFALSPFSWVYPGITVAVAAIGAMVLIAAVLVGLGVILFVHRDIVAG